MNSNSSICSEQSIMMNVHATKSISPSIAYSDHENEGRLFRSRSDLVYSVGTHNGRSMKPIDLEYFSINNPVSHSSNPYGANEVSLFTLARSSPSSYSQQPFKMKEENRYSMYPQVLSSHVSSNTQSFLSVSEDQLHMSRLLNKQHISRSNKNYYNQESAIVPQHSFTHENGLIPTTISDNYTHLLSENPYSMSEISYHQREKNSISLRYSRHNFVSSFEDMTSLVSYANSNSMFDKPSMKEANTNSVSMQNSVNLASFNQTNHPVSSISSNRASIAQFENASPFIPKQQQFSKKQYSDPDQLSILGDDNDFSTRKSRQKGEKNPDAYPGARLCFEYMNKGHCKRMDSGRVCKFRHLVISHPDAIADRFRSGLLTQEEIEKYQLRECDKHETNPFAPRDAKICFEFLNRHVCSRNQDMKLCRFRHLFPEHPDAVIDRMKMMEAQVNSDVVSS